MKPIKVGLVGIGRAGWGMHTNELDTRADHYKIVAACDILPERVEKMQKRYEGCRGYSKIEELLKDDEVELVIIATRSADHYAHAKIALEAGKDVLLEKPMCINYDDAYDLFARANKPGLPRLFIRQQRRFEALFSAVYKEATSGKLGKIFEINIEQNGFEHRADWQTFTEFGGGQMLNWGPHIIDHTLQLLGAPVADLRCEMMQVAAGGDCEDHFRIHLRGTNSVVAHMCISGATALHQGRYFNIYGTRGSLVAEGKTIKLRYISPEQETPTVVSDPGTPGAVFGTSGTYSSDIKLNWVEEEINVGADNMNVFWDYLYQSYREGATFPIKENEVLALMKTISDAKAAAEKVKFN